MSTDLRRERRRVAGRPGAAAVAGILALATVAVAIALWPRPPSPIPPPPTRAAGPTRTGDPPAGPIRPADSERYLTLAKQGIADARRKWWNPQLGWYNDRLYDHDQYPLATIWTLFGLFEAIEGVALAEPTPANRDAVQSFATVAETYYNRSMGGYGPYQGSHTYGDEIWFDDNGWWGLAFVDAYRVTHDRRYLGDAALALRFLDKQGWDAATQRMRWSTRVHEKGSNLETLGGAAALAAELYEYTGKTAFRDSARRYIRAADRRAAPSPSNGRLYGSPDEPPLSYIEGTMIGAKLALCHRGDSRSCADAWRLAIHSYRHWKGRDPFYKPPADTILFRYVLQLATDRRAAAAAARAHVRVAPAGLYAWARRAADDALRKGRIGILFLKFWDGSAAAAHRDGYRSYRYGQLMTHGAPVALFAWLAAVPRLESAR
ncbi:MAG: hypothetical protein JOZ25_05440 [Actinobacteria bacterium]|nr:hypothetical protein [Actinomycetota bacterium]